MSAHREHYQPRPVRRASAAFDLIVALVVAALFFGPFFVYFWSMKP